MARALRTLFSIAAASAAAIGISGATLAHSGEWGVFLDPTTSWPGGAVHVRGDVPSTGPIELLFVGPDAATVLAATIEDAANGHFETTITVPPAFAPGAWTVEARAAGMDVVRAPLVLHPPPPPGEDEGVQTDPSGVPRASVGSAPGGATAVGSASAPSDGIDLVPFAAAGLAIAALLLLVRRSRRPAASR